MAWSVEGDSFQVFGSCGADPAMQSFCSLLLIPVLIYPSPIVALCSGGMRGASAPFFADYVILKDEDALYYFLQSSGEDTVVRPWEIA